ncbi:MAG TPA: penicillin-binding protein 2 [Actinomycetota bacterium]|nr:penicillin-binding protein 2 [Actinomycetota bacterium]
MKRPPIGRLVALLCTMCLALGAIFVRLAVLQVSQAEALQGRARDQRLRTIELPAQRGQILDRSGEALAMTLPARDVYADPRYVTEPWATATRLAPLLGVDATDLLDLLAIEDTSFVYLARQIGLDAASRIEDLELPGVGLLPSNRRLYPAGPLAGQLLGFVGVDGEGLSGLEHRYEILLAGTAGERTVEIDPLGKPISGGIALEREPVAGASIVTTLDRDLQYQAQVALERAVEAQRARGGTVIVLDPRTGEILAMASYPWFDPNAFEEAPASALRARAITDAFEPGSTNKVITAAAAIQEGVVAPDDVLLVPWRMDVDEFTIHDSHRHPTMRMTLGDVMSESSNIGMAMIAQRLGAPELAAYLARFGLGQTTGVGFPGEAEGLMLPLGGWGEAGLATIAYGQGISSTPIQLASVFATIANDGRWVEPRLVTATIDGEGDRDEIPASEPRRVVSAETAQLVTQMLAYAVEHGTGSRARIHGFQVAGKTGTARIPRADGPGYLPGEYIASFIGYLPAGDPEIVVAAILDRPAEDYGGLVAAPLFRDVARAAIARLHLQPAERVPLPPHVLPVP